MPKSGSERKLRSSPTQATPASGLAEFEQVPCGAWTVKATKDGFEDSSLAVEITSDSAAEVIVTMNPKINRSTLEVTDTPPPVDQSSSQNYELHPSEVKNPADESGHRERCTATGPGCGTVARR